MTISLDHLPLNRLRALARYGAAARAQAIARMAPERRMATLLAFAHAFERTAMDDALDLLDRLVSDIVRGAHKEGETERLRTLHDLDAAALHLWEALQVLLDQTVEADAIRIQTFARVPRAPSPCSRRRSGTVHGLPTTTITQNSSSATSSVRRFLPTLLRTVAFEGTQAGQPLLEAWTFSARLSTNVNPICSKRLWTGCHARGVVSSNRRVKPQWIGAPIPCVPWNAYKRA